MSRWVDYWSPPKLILEVFWSTIPNNWKKEHSENCPLTQLKHGEWCSEVQTRITIKKVKSWTENIFSFHSAWSAFDAFTSQHETSMGDVNNNWSRISGQPSNVNVSYGSSATSPSSSNSTMSFGDEQTIVDVGINGQPLGEMKGETYWTL